MKFNLTQILESTVLLEGRLEDMKKKYEGNDAIIDDLSANDPSGNNKYLEWMTKQMFKNQFSMPDVISGVELFHTSIGRLQKEKKPADIFQYKTPKDIHKMVGTLNRRDKPTKAELKGHAELVYDGPDLFVVAPRNYEGSCKFGRGTEWCIRLPDTDRYWKDYTKHSLFYFIISKKLSSDTTNYKVALQKKMDTGRNSYWNKPDKESSECQNPDFTPDILAVIDAHAIEAKKWILKKLVEDMIDGVKSTLSYDNIMKTKELLTDGQLYKIITHDLMFLNQRGSYGTNQNQTLFGYVSDKLGKDNTLKLLKTNYDNFAKLLSNDVILNWVDENTDRPDKTALANAFKGHLGKVTPNVRTKIRKWGMSDADWERYRTQSKYVYLGEMDSQRPIGEIHKVDEHDPKSYDIISQLKFKLKYKEVKLYGIVSKKDELDEYMGGGEIPDEIFDSLKIQVIPTDKK